MLKLSEVCQQMGITRRTLQEYKKVGLLEPTQITFNGYWYYDEESLKKLELILMFVEAGYERKRIKEIINLDKQDIIGEFEIAIGLLQKRKEKIDGMIYTLEIMKETSLLPDTIPGSSSKLTENKHQKKPNYIQKLREVFNILGSTKGINVYTTRFIVTFFKLFTFYANDRDTEIIHQQFDELIYYGSRFIPGLNEETQGMTEDEVNEIIITVINTLLRSELCERLGNRDACEDILNLFNEYTGFSPTDEVNEIITETLNGYEYTDAISLESNE